MLLRTDDPLAVAAIDAIHAGDVPRLKKLLAEHPELATATIGENDPSKSGRTLLHVATDWPGHFPNVAEVIVALVAAGADVNAKAIGSHHETPLHWAASANDVEALDALLDAGADINVPGGVIGGGSPLADATAFKQWQAARRLVQRGAKTTISEAAALGLLDRVKAYLSQGDVPKVDVDRAFWAAAHGGQQRTAEHLLTRGADINWIPDWEDATPLDAASRSGVDDLVAWLRSRGARSAKDTTPQGSQRGA